MDYGALNIYLAPKVRFLLITMLYGPLLFVFSWQKTAMKNGG